MLALSLPATWIPETADLPSGSQQASIQRALSQARPPVVVSLTVGWVKGRLVTQLGQYIPSKFVFSLMLELKNSWWVRSLVAEAMHEI